MKIAIASSGRFHVLSLARELSKLGMSVDFYSYVPSSRATRFGLPAHCHRGLLFFVAPLVLWQRYAPHFFPLLSERAMASVLNMAVKLILRPCDVFICMSGTYLEAAIYAKKKYGAKIWIERGSRHILSQYDILDDIGALNLPSKFTIERELAGYELADRIVVPSSHVLESFLEYDPALLKKIFVNPYGVDLEKFPSNAIPTRSDEADRIVLFVGAWSIRKGVDILVEAIRKLKNVKLIHVGGIVDFPFPHSDQQFTHINSVPEWQLKDFYAQADVFVLASREEGLALVLLQALAMGLPIVCTLRTGGQDLALSEELRKRIHTVAVDDINALSCALERVLGEFENHPLRLPEADRKLLSWSEYGSRYNSELLNSIN